MQINNELQDLIIKYANKYSLNPAVVFGICCQESLCNPYAARFEPHYKWLYKPNEVRPRMCSLETEKILQKTSWGLMQVMGGVYREHGFEGWLTKVATNPEIQLDYGCKHLSKKIRRWGGQKGILAYNSGSPRKGKDGRYVNAYYLKKVVRYGEKFHGD